VSSRREFDVYAGDGSTLKERGGSFDPPDPSAAVDFDDPAGYIAEQGLRDAVNVSLALGQPLLVTGEPGTGKTQLAASIAHELSLPPPLVFRTKTTSTAKDLFYRYDSLRHFHDVQFRREFVYAKDYITYEALGLAVLLSLEPEKVREHLPEGFGHERPVRSVVLIDEIDKAPRDLPNDILNEVDELSFTVPETGTFFAAGKEYKPIIVLTSNSEKNLPDAFLRRCVFHHISFPAGDALAEIVRRRLRPSHTFTPEMVTHAIEHFELIRDMALKKRPATAELLAWMRVLERLDLDVAKLKPGELETLAFTYSVLVKNKDDRDVILKQLLHASHAPDVETGTSA
jgi:MoxR-like ATPase